MALLITFAGELAFVPIILLALAQVVTLNSLGLDLARSIVYGFLSLLAPVGYSRCRDPDNQPYGLSLLPGKQMSFHLLYGTFNRTKQRMSFNPGFNRAKRTLQ